jgi:hypothetical protein
LAELVLTLLEMVATISGVIGGGLPVKRLARLPTAATIANVPVGITLPGAGFPTSTAIWRTNSSMDLFSPPSRYEPPF